MLSIGFLYAFAATLCWAAAVFPLTAASRKLAVNSMNHLRLLVAALLILIAAICIERNNFFAIFSSGYMQGWLWLGLSGVTALVVGDFFSFRSYAILSPQLGSVLTTMSPASALLFGIVLVDEHINLIGIIGMTITITGVMSISLGRAQRKSIPDHGHGGVSKGIVFGILAAACHGAALAFSKKGFLVQAGTQYPVGPLSATFIRIIAALIIVYIVSIARGKFKEAWKHIGDSRPGIKNTIIGSVFNPVLSVSFSMFTILYINVAEAQTIFALVPLFAMLIAFLIFKEKITFRAMLGAIVALTGVILLVWRNKI